MPQLPNGAVPTDDRPAFPAKYTTLCAECDSYVEPGELIRRAPPRAGRPDGWIHADRADCVRVDTNEDAEAMRNPRCGRCGTNHPGEC